jgi:6-phosphogluconolactonase (cycloisomerase 2 family)
VYCSNRGHDSIAIYRTNATTGLLTPAGWQPTLGAGPRFEGLDPAGRFLYAANEGGDAIVTFAVDAASGGLRSTGQVIKIASPVTIAFTTNP